MYRSLGIPVRGRPCGTAGIWPSRARRTAAGPGTEAIGSEPSKEHHSHIEEVSRFMEAGQVAPIVDRTYPLAEVPDAMGHLEAGQARGKIAITVLGAPRSVDPR